MKNLSPRRRLHLLSDLAAVEIFVSVVETCNFTRTAHRLGITPATVSKKLFELEERANAQLLNRTTRRVSVTDAGHEFYGYCQRILEDAETAEQALRSSMEAGRGRILVTVPMVFGERRIAPLLPGFLRRYPDIRIELDASPRTVNLKEAGFDLSVRMTTTSRVGVDDTVIASNHRLFCATPDYLAVHGTPVHPTELARHHCLVSVGSRSHETWRYLEDGQAREVGVSGPLTSNNVGVLKQAALRDLGVAFLGTSVMEEELRSGALQQVLTGFEPRDGVIVAVLPNRSRAARHVRLFIDYLRAELANEGPPAVDAQAASHVRRPALVAMG